MRPESLRDGQKEISMTHGATNWDGTELPGSRMSNNQTKTAAEKSFYVFLNLFCNVVLKNSFAFEVLFKQHYFP